MTRKRITHICCFLTCCFLTCAPSAWAGGAWLPDKGDGFIQMGFTRKTTDTGWDADGQYGPASPRDGQALYHDFRYAYLTGEVGLPHKLSASFLFTYLWGFEGRDRDHLESNFGLSDTWLGLKYQIKDGAWPLAAKVLWRTPFLYDQQGPYERQLYDDEGNFVMHNPEWRGILRNDLALGFALSHSMERFPGWMVLEAAYNFREGAPADDIPVYFEVGYTLPIESHNPHLKAAFNLVKSVGNDSPREPHDRFGAGPGFNDASMLRGAVSLLWPVDRWLLEVGYGQWLWGRNARRYREPFVGMGYNF